MSKSRKKKNSNYMTKSRAERVKAQADEKARRQRRRKLIAWLVTAAVVLLLIGGIVLLIAAPWKYNTPRIGSGGACEYLGERDISGRDIKYVEMEVKGYGSVVILLDATTAPETVNNFISLTKSGFYDGLTFHRVINDFMIQGGDPKANGMGGSDKEIVGEFSKNGHENDIKHIKGVISMARGDAYNSASSQFFICNGNSASVFALDGSYAAFGYVVAGLDIIDEITEDSLRYTGKNGAISSKSDQAVIRSMRVLEGYNS